MITDDHENFCAFVLNPIGPSAAPVDFTAHLSLIELIANPEKPVVEIRITNIFQNTETTQRLPATTDEMGFIFSLGAGAYGCLLVIGAVRRRP